MVRDSHRSGRRTPKYNKQKRKEQHIYRLDTTITQHQVIGVSTPPKIMVHVQKKTSYTNDIHKTKWQKEAIHSRYVNMSSS